MTERDAPETNDRDGRHRRMSLRHEAETDGPSVLHVFPSWGYPSAPFVLAFAVSKADVPETDSAETDDPWRRMPPRRRPLRRMSQRGRKAETDVPETDGTETEEGGDGGH